MDWSLTESDLVSFFADDFFEGFTVTIRQREELLDEEEVEEFLFDFRVHYDFVGHV